MRKSINILIIDPFPIALLGYELCLKKYDKEFSFNLIVASSIKEALDILNERTAIFFHTILLDVDMKNTKISDIQSGEDLAKSIKTKYPQTKIIALTERNDSLRLYQIVNAINPNALITKAGLKKETFLNAVKAVLAQQKVYYSKSKDFTREHYCS